ncbi:fibronectin-binding protein [Mycolicibacterium diernhoferi]|uniref:Fibronectin-binding protein n=2 Tax=Mycolicibacterium diernhoferi TaxID=1801 RepID=A0A2A7NZR3_9MYCO|nr:fibronectin-binding protein [Mycolicibacterium diernhoferi]PEG55982.1 fibronectin-binding protein [Mycolicibacterium diernhoferi]QYL22348.1 fibronectin-binding protein [Mycolicibacterium diernhoferi]
MPPRTALAALAAGAAMTLATTFATPVNASPVDNPCELAVTFLCQFMPIAPDLEHDIDLTVDQPPVDPADPAVPPAPPAVLP